MNFVYNEFLIMTEQRMRRIQRMSVFIIKTKELGRLKILVLLNTWGEKYGDLSHLIISIFFFFFSDRDKSHWGM